MANMKFALLPSPIEIQNEAQAKELAKAMSQLPEGSVIAIDTETTGLSVNKKNKAPVTADDILCWSLACPRGIKKSSSLLIEDTFIEEDTNNILGGYRFFLLPEHLPLFEKELFLNPKIIKVCHNLKYDQHCITNYFRGLNKTPSKNADNIICQPKTDTLLMHWLLDERLPHGLKDVSSEILHINMTPYKKLFKGKEQELMEQDRTTVVEYASLDAYVTANLFIELRDQLKNIEWMNGKSLWDYYWEIERYFTDVLFDMERLGILINKESLLNTDKLIKQELLQIQSEFNKLSGYVINIDSPKQLGDLFYGKLKFPILNTTAGGKGGITSASTDEKTLVALKSKVDSPLPDLVLRRRRISKLRSTYVEGILRSLEYSPDQRLRYSLNQAGTRTGRLSGSNPNTQNIPRADEDEFKIRWAFIASPGKTFIIADYSQAEVRLIAHLAGDEKLKEAIISGDIYRQVYAAMFGMKPEEVTPAERKLAKVIVLGTNYGMGPGKLMAGIASTVGWENTKFNDIENKFDLCRSLLVTYFNTYPDLKTYIDYTPIVCRQVTPMPVVRTLLGRYRRLPELIGSDKGTVMAAERESINTGPQGGVADMLRGAMIQLHNNKELEELDAKLLMQIHDEVVIEIDKDKAEQGSKIVEDIMINPLRPYGIELSVPLEIEMKIEDAWKKA